MYELAATSNGPFRRDAPDVSLLPAGHEVLVGPDEPLLPSAAAAASGMMTTAVGPTASTGAALSLPKEEGHSLPRRIFYDGIKSRATRWLLRLDVDNAGCDDWMIWSIPFVLAKLQ
eukprot:255438-Pyramimonas_sp.AAC.1